MPVSFRMVLIWEERDPRHPATTSSGWRSDCRSDPDLKLIVFGLFITKSRTRSALCHSRVLNVPTYSRKIAAGRLGVGCEKELSSQTVGPQITCSVSNHQAKRPNGPLVKSKPTLLGRSWGGLGTAGTKQS